MFKVIIFNIENMLIFLKLIHRFNETQWKFQQDILVELDELILNLYGREKGSTIALSFLRKSQIQKSILGGLKT